MKALAPVGRALFSAIFIMSGISHFAQLDTLTSYAAAAGLPAPAFMVIVSGAFLLLGGLAVLTGAFARLGAGLIAVFLLVAAFTVHAYWRIADPAMAQMQLLNFMKNLSMAGGALLIVYFGPGPYSVRRRARDRGRAAQVQGPYEAEPLRP